MRLTWTLALSAWAIAASPVRAGMLYVLNDFANSNLEGGANIETVTSSGGINSFVEPGSLGSAAYNLAFNASGNLFVDGGGGLAIYEVTPTGSVSTFATFTSSDGIAFNAQGNLFVSGSLSSSDVTRNNIYEVNPSGIVSHFATMPANVNLNGLAIDTAGDIFAAGSNGDIYEVTPSGSVSIVASGLNNPLNLTFGPSGDLFVSANSPNGATSEIFKVTPTGTVSTFFSGYNQGIDGLAFNSAGDLLYADTARNGVFEVTSTNSSSLFAGGFTYGPVALAFQPGSEAAVPEPCSLTLFSIGAIGMLVVRRRHHRVRSAGQHLG